MGSAAKKNSATNAYQTHDCDVLPNGWSISKLDQIGSWGSGGTPKRTEAQYFGGDIPWAIIGDMADGPLWTTESSITDLGLQNSSAKIVPEGTLLVAMYGSIGKLAISKVPMATNQAIAHCIIDSRIVCRNFLFYYLLSERSALLSKGQGGTQSNISQTILKAHPIPLAPLAEQRRIVSRIDELFSRIEAGERAIEEARAGLKRYRKAVLKAAVTGALTEDWRAANPPEETGADLLTRILEARRTAWLKAETQKLKAKGKPAPKTAAEKEKLLARYAEPAFVEQGSWPNLANRWVWGSIDQITAHFANGLSRKPVETATDFPILRISAVRSMAVNSLDTRNYAPTGTEDLSGYWVQTDDLLFTRYNGSAELVGVCGRYTGTRPVLHPDKLMRATIASPSYCLPAWIEIACNAGSTASFIASCVKTSAGQHGIAGSDVKRAAVPLPPPAEQAEIVSRVEEALSRADAAEATLDAQSRAARALKQSILKAAFTGRLVPQDPADEPASELMKRIKAGDQ